MIKKINTFLDFLFDCLIVGIAIFFLCFFVTPIIALLTILIGFLLILCIPAVIIAIVWYIVVGINKLYKYIKKFFKKNKYPIDK